MNRFLTITHPWAACLPACAPIPMTRSLVPFPFFHFHTHVSYVAFYPQWLPLPPTFHRSFYIKLSSMVWLHDDRRVPSMNEIHLGSLIQSIRIFSGIFFYLHACSILIHPHPYPLFMRQIIIPIFMLWPNPPGHHAFIIIWNVAALIRVHLHVNGNVCNCKSMLFQGMTHAINSDVTSTIILEAGWAR